LIKCARNIPDNLCRSDNNLLDEAANAEKNPAVFD